MYAPQANTIPGRGRPAAIIALLALALVFIGVLGWQSWRLQQANAATADAVLRDYGLLAADEFGRRATANLGYRGYYPLAARLAGRESVAAMYAALTADAELTEAADLVAGFFIVEGDEIDSAGLLLSDELRALLGRIASAPGPADVPYHSRRTASGREQVVYRVIAGPEGKSRIGGFVVSAPGIRDHLDKVFDAGPLLPPSLAGGRIGNNRLFLRVADPGGAILLEEHPAFRSRLTVTRVLGDDYQGILEGFRIEVSPDPAAAGLLVIGGLPKSQLPLLVAVMGLVVLLMVTAIWLFRREQALMRLRADFLSQVSHELRTPLTQIRMFAETLLLGRAPSDRDRRRSLEIIDRESRRLSHLVDNILQFSGGAAADRLDCVSQPLAPIVAEVCDIVRRTAKSVTVSTYTDGSARACIDADALRQIVQNLLDNAIKFGPAGQTIAVSLLRQSGFVWLTVEDEGPGIPESERRRVWKPFYRMRREADTAISGTGIGLAVVAELVTAMHGRCRIEAGANGTRVCLEFPEATSDEQSQ